MTRGSQEWRKGCSDVAWTYGVATSVAPTTKYTADRRVSGVRKLMRPFECPVLSTASAMTSRQMALRAALWNSAAFVAWREYVMSATKAPHSQGV